MRAGERLLRTSRRALEDGELHAEEDLLQVLPGVEELILLKLCSVEEILLLGLLAAEELLLSDIVCVEELLLLEFLRLDGLKLLLGSSCGFLRSFTATEGKPVLGSPSARLPCETGSFSE